MTKSVVIAFLFCCACSPEERELQLVFSKAPEGDYRGFRCVSDDAQPRPLTTRGIVPAEQRAEYNLVVDFVSIGGNPDCRDSRLRAWCQEHDCAPLLEHRECIPVHVPLQAPNSLPESIVSAIEGLAGTSVSLDGPQGPVIIRVTATVQPCQELASSAAFADDALVGCMFSCPTVLDSQEGDILLDLGIENQDCLPALRWCAAPDFRFE